MLMVAVWAPKGQMYRCMAIARTVVYGEKEEGVHAVLCRPCTIKKSQIAD